MKCFICYTPDRAGNPVNRMIGQTRQANVGEDRHSGLLPSEPI